jgi:hypothetical protein
VNFILINLSTTDKCAHIPLCRLFVIKKLFLPGNINKARSTRQCICQENQTSVKFAEKPTASMIKQKHFGVELFFRRGRSGNINSQINKLWPIEQQACCLSSSIEGA